MLQPHGPLVAAAAMLLAAGAATAQFTILDTGTPVGDDFPALSLFNDGPIFQNLGAFFSTSEMVTVVELEAHMNSAFGDLAFAITGVDSGGLPDISNTLFSTTESFSVTGRDWRGVDGLSWDLPAGDYWFVLLPELGFSSSLPYGAPDPTAVAFENEGSGGWALTSNDDVGFRITAIPAPGSAALLALAGLAASRRRR